MMSKFGFLRGSKAQTKRRSLCEYPAEQRDTFADEASQDCLDSRVCCVYDDGLVRKVTRRMRRCEALAWRHAHGRLRTEPLSSAASLSRCLVLLVPCPSAALFHFQTPSQMHTYITLAVGMPSLTFRSRILSYQHHGPTPLRT